MSKIGYQFSLCFAVITGSVKSDDLESVLEKLANFFGQRMPGMKKDEGKPRSTFGE